MLQRLKVGDIVHPDDRAKAREFECPICLSVPSISVAVQSVCCNVIFCSDCLAPLGACPNCRADIPADGNTVALNPLVRRMLQNLKVFCPHHVDAWGTERPLAASSANSPAVTNDSHATAGGGICTDKSRDGSGEHTAGYCDWAGNYGDLLTKHIAGCAYAEIDCPHGCGERFLRGQLSTHEEGCEKGYEGCGICGVMVKIGGMAGHRAEAAEAHVKILESQSIERGAVLVRVDAVRTELSKLIAMNGLGSHVIWRVKTGEMFELCKAKGDPFESPEFHFGADYKFSIAFLPLGADISEEGKVALGITSHSQTLNGVYFPGYLEVVVSAVGNEFATISQWCSWQNFFESSWSYGGYGFSNFMDISDLRKAPEIVVSFRHADGDNGSTIELGVSGWTHSTRSRQTVVLGSAMETFGEEMTAMKAEFRGLSLVVDNRHERVRDDMAAVLQAVQALSAGVKAVQAEVKEQFQTQKAAEARTMGLVSFGVTAVAAAAVICLAVVVGRK